MAGRQGRQLGSGVLAALRAAPTRRSAPRRPPVRALLPVAGVALRKDGGNEAGPGLRADLTGRANSQRGKRSAQAPAPAGAVGDLSRTAAIRQKRGAEPTSAAADAEAPGEADHLARSAGWGPRAYLLCSKYYYPLEYSIQCPYLLDSKRGLRATMMLESPLTERQLIARFVDALRELGLLHRACTVGARFSRRGLWPGACGQAFGSHTGRTRSPQAALRQ